MSEIDQLIKQLSSLHVEESRILGELKVAREKETSIKTTKTVGSVRRLGEFKPGDRVAFKTVRFPHTGPNERRAVVTAVVNERVHVQTLSGRTTWRAPKNLTLLL